MAIVLAWRFSSGVSPRSGAIALEVATGGVLLVLGPWSLRNGDQLGTLSPSTGLGPVLEAANTASTYGGRLIGSFDPHAAARSAEAAIEAGEGNHLDSLEAAIDHARANARRLPAVGAARVSRTFGLWGPDNEQVVRRAGVASEAWWRLTWIGSLIVLGLAAWGLYHQRGAWRPP